MSWRGRLSTNMQEVRIFFCTSNPASAGTYSFWQKNYSLLQKLNPRLPILMRPAENVPPVMFARFDWGVEEKVELDNLDEKAVEDKLKWLVELGETKEKSAESCPKDRDIITERDTRWGITDPISMATPTDKDRELTRRLEDLLKAYPSVYESDEQSRKREEILGKLDMLVKEWGYQTCLSKGMTEGLAREAGVKIYTFGPKHITREDFFTGLHDILKAREDVTELSSVPDAYVPVMKFEFDTVSIDLLYVSLDKLVVPKELDLQDEGNLQGLDGESVRSLNGCRVTDKILRLIPSIPNFRTTLRCIKIWAKERGVYANVLGYVAGISCALLVARICQLYPTALPSTLVSRFFMVLSQWKWPNPVILCHINHDGEYSLGLPVWDPKSPYTRDRYDLMPIITPAYPCMNSTYNVSYSTRALMQEEFERGANVTFQIETNNKPWATLFEKTDFFYKYYVYIKVDALTTGEESLLKWSGWVESRLRHLIRKLQDAEYVHHAYPCPKSFPIPEEGKWTNNCCWFLGLTYEKKQNLNLIRAAKEFMEMVRGWQFRIDESKQEDMDIKITHVKRKDLPDFVKDPEVEARYRVIRRAKRKEEKEKAAKIAAETPAPAPPTATVVDRVISPSGSAPAAAPATSVACSNAGATEAASKANSPNGTNTEGDAAAPTAVAAAVVATAAVVADRGDEILGPRPQARVRRVNKRKSAPLTLELAGMRGGPAAAASTASIVDGAQTQAATGKRKLDETATTPARGDRRDENGAPVRRTKKRKSDPSLRRAK